MLLFILFSLGLSKKEVAPIDWQGNLAKVYSITMAPDGRIFFAVPSEGVIYQTDLQGQALPSIGKKGEGPEEFNWPRNIFYEAPYLYVYDGAKEKLFRFDGVSGKFLRAWPIDSIGAFSVQGNLFHATLRKPQSGHILAFGRIGTNKIAFDHLAGNTPCCLQVSGSKKSAIFSAQDGSVWIAHTGDFQLLHYQEDGTLLQKIDTGLPDYVAPSNHSKRISPLNVKARSSEPAQFDKIDGLYACNEQIILYRYKTLNNSYFDVFDSSGGRIISQKGNNISPVGVKNNVLYGFLRDTENAQWDIMLVAIGF